MALASGTRLGPYEIVSALGAGGMGEVYRACDPRLGREVAIQVLPTAFFSSGPASIGGSVLVSRGGGTAPRWRGDGREIFYLAPNGKMMAAAVGPEQEFRAGTPAPLFQTPSGSIVGDVTADGTRFLLIAPVGPSAPVPFTVVLNWTAALKR
jgi:serine/threonine protein kinase